MEAGMLSLHLMTKAVLGEEVVRPKVLPGNFDFSFHLPDGEKQLRPPSSRIASQPNNVNWADHGTDADNQASRHARQSPKIGTDTEQRGRMDNKEHGDSSTFQPLWKPPVQKDLPDRESNIPRASKQAENGERAHSQQNILTEWLGRGEEQNKPREKLAEAAEEMEDSLTEAGRVESPSGEKMGNIKTNVNYMTQRLRCKNVLMAYALLDPYNRGYVDVQEAVQIVARIKSFRGTSKHANDVAELLLVMVHDLLPYVSSRGVIEKEDFLKQIYERVNADYAGLTPYFCLRSNANPFVHARHERELYTSLFSRAFYGGDYVPDGVAIHNEAETGELRNGLHVQGGSFSAPYFNHRPKVPGTLEDHVRQSQLRSMRRRARIKEEQLMKELEECTFRPVTTPAPCPQKPIFPSRRQIREILLRQNEKRYGCPAVVYDLDPTVERTPALPPELDPREKQKFEEFRKKEMLGTRKEHGAACEDFLAGSAASTGASVGSPYAAQGAFGKGSQEDDELSVKEAEPTVYVIHNGDPPPRAADWGLPLRDDWITQLPADDSGGEEKRRVGRHMRPGREPSERKALRSHGARVHREKRPSSGKRISSEGKDESASPPLKTQTEYQVCAPYLVQPRTDVPLKASSSYGYVHDWDLDTASGFSLKMIPLYYREALERLVHEQLGGTGKSNTDELVLQKAKQISEEVTSMVVERSPQES